LAAALEDMQLREKNREKETVLSADRLVEDLRNRVSIPP
jgi:hypothetical protein